MPPIYSSTSQEFASFSKVYDSIHATSTARQIHKMSCHRLNSFPLHVNDPENIKYIVGYHLHEDRHTFKQSMSRKYTGAHHELSVFLLHVYT